MTIKKNIQETTMRSMMSVVTRKKRRVKKKTARKRKMITETDVETSQWDLWRRNY